MPSFRPAKMASLVRDLISDAIANKLNDPRISPLASVTRVEVSGDLTVAKVYVSVYGSERDSRRTLRGLDHAAGHIQRLLARQLQTRHCPEVRFLADASVKGTFETVRVIEESVRADEQRHGGVDPPPAGPVQEDADGANG